ncbi:uncharacterized protein LOC132697206 [Cylas formicarius]|uniref:uncharacterized protein LOC132697206 n=1 Tax=Cylas formicarius TaxID=197179 RepID=UPI0029587D18|nr:uncharacterized protein LOC132697206 [Cylas formicarius]
MKVVLLLFACIITAHAGYRIPANSADFIKGLLPKYVYDSKSLTASLLTALVNNAADKLFDNIGVYALSNGLDPIALADVDQTLLGSGVRLTEGSFSGVSSFARNGNVSVTYSPDTKVLTLSLPIKFDKLSFSYKYKVSVVLISYNGVITGTISDVRVDVAVSFDFNTYKAKVESLKMTNTGKIDVTFDSGITGVVINILSELVTTVLHPLLVQIIQSTVFGVVNDVVDSVNDAIDGIFTPPSEVPPSLLFYK